MFLWDRRLLWYCALCYGRLYTEKLQHVQEQIRVVILLAQPWEPNGRYLAKKDETKIIIVSFPPSDTNIATHIYKCLADVSKWMANHLKLGSLGLNPDLHSCTP